MEKTELPAAFAQKLKRLLGASYEAFLQSYQEEQSHGLRVNTLKLEAKTFEGLSPFLLEPVLWADAGYYYPHSDEVRPGRHPYHEAGLYYIQEPSAMAVGALVGAKPGERVLDLCAAPGGKTTQIAAGMRGSGLLVANEPHPSRAKILSRNVERMGIVNAMVTNETPERLSARFPAYFDRVLVDAPCSGEGMFRKNPEARLEWREELVALCAQRQLKILGEAQKMLAPGGRLVYSTCTFSPEEDEGVISRFLREYPAFEVEKLRGCPAFSKGRPDWIPEPSPGLSGTFRLWPHVLRGEGHFIAVLRKTAGESGKEPETAPPLKNKKIAGLCREFEQERLVKAPGGRLFLYGTLLYRIPEEMPDPDKLRVLRPGLCVGEIKKERFTPAHALALALPAAQLRDPVRLTGDGAEPCAYLRGETLPAGGKGFRAVLVDGYPLGWGKAGGGILKNHYPKGLRWMY